MITWRVEADFDRDGTWSTDLTPWVTMPGHGVTISRGVGRDGKPRTSSMSLALNNQDGRFTPHNMTSPLYGLLEPGVPIRLTATYQNVDYTIWTGYAMTWSVNWSAGAVPMCRVDCDDLLEVMRSAPAVNVTASTTRTTGQAINAVLDAIGIDVGARHVDAGVQSLPMHFAVGEEPLSALMAVAASEMGGMLWCDAQGRVRFESRASRVRRQVDDTWGVAGGVVPVSIEVEHNPLELVTSVSARGTKFIDGQADTPIFAFSQNMFTKPTATSMALAAGEIYERVFQANSVYVALTQPVAVVDYLANSAQNGSGTDRTSNLEVTVTDLGGGRFRLRLRNTYTATIYVTKFQIRGQPTEFFADRPEAAFSLSQDGLPAGRELRFDVPFAGDTGQKLRDYAYQELRVGRYPWPTLHLVFQPTGSAIPKLLAAELGDLIKYADLVSGVNDTWYIESLTYQVPPNWAGKSFNCQVALVPSYVYRDLNKIVFDTFDRANGSLGTSFSGDTWTAGSFAISSNAAGPTSTTLQTPHVAVA
jgi:hypothetical protein